jgi:hypothetical protein
MEDDCKDYGGVDAPIYQFSLSISKYTELILLE